MVGSEEVTFTGVNFSDDYTHYSISIDGITCDPTAATATSVTCTTGARVGAFTLDPHLEIFIQDVGLVANQGHEFRYVSLWSSPTTWEAYRSQSTVKASE